MYAIIRNAIITKLEVRRSAIQPVFRQCAERLWCWPKVDQTRCVYSWRIWSGSVPGCTRPLWPAAQWKPRSEAGRLMEGLDKRAPFTATGGIIPPEFRNIKTPCYILDEKSTYKKCKLLAWQSGQDVRCSLYRKRSAIMTVISFLSRILRVQRPVDCLRQD